MDSIKELLFIYFWVLAKHHLQKRLHKTNFAGKQICKKATTDNNKNILYPRQKKEERDSRFVRSNMVKSIFILSYCKKGHYQNLGLRLETQMAGKRIKKLKETVLRR